MNALSERILLQAITTYGVESQFRMLQEECCELAHAVSKSLRTSAEDGHLESEIADVLIMIAQVRMILAARSPTHDDGVQAHIDRKMARLHARLETKEAL